MAHLLYRISKLIPTALRPAWQRSFSQEGEDIVLATFFGREFQGIYVDIGAHHPTHGSNTKRLAERGWWGLNIDPRPGLTENFKKHRPRDICMEVGIDIGAGQSLYYWMFNIEPRWNCLAPTEPVVERGGEVIRPDAHHAVPVVPIADALARADLPHVDLINIDIEGGEEYILRHWPWDRYLPKAICVEIIGQPAAEIATAPLTRFLAEKGLVFTSQMVCSVIYFERNFLATRYPSDPSGTHFRRACLNQAEAVQL